jgi:hypothetical protein
MIFKGIDAVALPIMRRPAQNPKPQIHKEVRLRSFIPLGSLPKAPSDSECGSLPHEKANPQTFCIRWAGRIIRNRLLFSTTSRSRQ